MSPRMLWLASRMHSLPVKLAPEPGMVCSPGQPSLSGPDGAVGVCYVFDDYDAAVAYSIDGSPPLGMVQAAEGDDDARD